MVNGIKTIATEEFKGQGITQSAKVCFMVEQLQHEVQQDILSSQKSFLTSYGRRLSEKISVSALDQLSTASRASELRLITQNGPLPNY